MKARCCRVAWQIFCWISWEYEPEEPELEVEGGEEADHVAKVELGTPSHLRNIHQVKQLGTYLNLEIFISSILNLVQTMVQWGQRWRRGVLSDKFELGGQQVSMRRCSGAGRVWWGTRTENICHGILRVASTWVSEQLFQGILGGGESGFNLRVSGTGAGYNMIKVLQGTKENRNGG